MKLEISKTREEVARSFSKFLSDFNNTGKEIHIALSGGSTPKIVFDELAGNYAEAIDWKKVHLYWGDERCVPPTDPESNYKMTVDHLLAKIDIPEGNVHRVRGEEDPEAEAMRYSGVLDAQLPKSNGVPKFDLVILGMGDDGHTASIFPYNIALWDSKSNCVVAAHPDSGQLRVSITGSIINAAETVAFLVTGSGKTEKVAEIIGKEGNYRSYPASLVAPKSGNLIWFLDSEAAKGIN